MFLGEYRHNLDTKNRLALPSRFRDALTEGAVVTRGLDNCLFLYPRSTWQTWVEKLSKLPISQSKSRAFLRMMLAGAMEVQLDGQGRIVVPEYLKEYGRIKKQVVIAGLNDRLEIWDQDAWQRYKESTEHESGHIAEGLSELGV